MHIRPGTAVAFAAAALLLIGAGCVPFWSKTPAPSAVGSPKPTPMPAPEPTPTPSPKTSGGCHPTGCSGQVCSDEEVITTCEFRAEFACYKSATCERQTNGACGWTPSPSLTACLETPSK